jgi:hypothetical protein
MEVARDVELGIRSPALAHGRANRLTGLYLAEAAERGMAPADLPDAAARELDLTEMSFRGRCLSRPVFLDHAEHARLVADLGHLYAALRCLPDRRFGGDLGAFAQAAGLAPEQAAAAQLAADIPLTRLARADLYHEADGFKLLEINIGSTIGGGDNAMVNRAMLTNPVLAGFVRAHGLTYVDTLAEIADTIAAETGITLGDGSLVAAVMWPPTASRFTGVMQTSANDLAGLGLDFVPCHLGHLSLHDHRVWLGQRPVDVIYRVFMIQNLLEPEGPALIDPILRAAEAGEVKLFTPMHAQLYSSKGALALLSDEVNRSLCTPAERASLDRLLPWTRMLRAGPVTVDGERADLLDYATSHRADLVLKPTARHGGQGIVTGWRAEAAEWDQHLRAALGGPFVLQRRVRPEPEEFPGPDGPELWVLTWGAYLSRRGYAGMWVRGEADRDTSGVNMATGAFATCCFHEPRASG